MKSKIKNNPDEIINFLSHLSNNSIPNNETEKISLSYSFLNEIIICALGKINPTILLGIHYEKYLEVIEHDDTSITNENFLKAFSDSKRLEIIRMLNGHEMFVSEITKNCDLSFSTTSYHIDILLNAGILQRRISNRRVYYKLNIDYLTRKLDQIKGLILSNTF
jgi:DNA-binding transcriptional ArsR family regulator